MLSQAITKNAVILGSFAAATAILIAVIFQSTKDEIARQERLAAQKALHEIISADLYDNDVLNDFIVLSQSQSAHLGFNKEVTKVHLAKQDHRITALVFESIAPDGYSGDIKLLIGIHINGYITGTRVLNHKETPGLGDKIDIKKSHWMLSFDGKSLADPSKDKWNIKKDGGEFDQFTGATITPRAIVRRIRQTLEFYEEQSDLLLSNPIEK